MLKIFLVTIIALGLWFVGGYASADEPAPPFVAGFDRFARHDQLRQQDAGRLLVSELSCVACHTSTDKTLSPKRGPDLTGVGNRVQLAWFRGYLLSPQTLKPGTTMPNVLAGVPSEQREDAADAIAAFLSTKQTAFPIFKATGANPLPHEFWNVGDADAGERLYHEIGCVACHEPSATRQADSPKSALDRLLRELSPEELAELGLTDAARPVNSIPLGDLPRKYSKQSLTHFLLSPHSVRPAGRMPDFNLEPIQAADIAAFLSLQDPVSTIPKRDPPKARVEAGREWFRKLRCANCHAGEDTVKPTASKPFANLSANADAGCIAEPADGLPHFPVDEEQRRALKAILGNASDLKHTVSPAIFALTQFNCFACHERDEQGGVGRNRRPFFVTQGHADLGDEGRIPPSLTGVGRKLKSDWMQNVIRGTASVRPYMSVRMPGFPNPIHSRLPALLAQEDSIQVQPPVQTDRSTEELSKAGRTLFDTGCVQCHAVQGESLPGVIGVDVTNVDSRLNQDWFREFLRNPIQVKRGTRMPTFFPNGKSTNQELLDGDVDAQIAALWTYLNNVPKHGLPEKLVEARSRDFELRPVDRPIIQRTFMNEAGRRAIAVGFPEKVHFAFDASQLRVAQVWRGRFLDAHGTWFDRFAPPAKPLGTDVVTLPNGPSLATLKGVTGKWPDSADVESSTFQFQGYSLDKDGVPTFKYRIASYLVSDQIHPNDQGGLQRMLSIRPEELDTKREPLWLLAATGKKLEKLSAKSYVDDRGMKVTVEGDGEDVLHSPTDEMSEWRVQLPNKSNVEISLSYQWANTKNPEN